MLTIETVLVDLFRWRAQLHRGETGYFFEVFGGPATVETFPTVQEAARVAHAAASAVSHAKLIESHGAQPDDVTRGLARLTQKEPPEGKRLTKREWDALQAEPAASAVKKEPAR